MKSFSVFRMSEACQVDTWPIETQIAMISVSGSFHQCGNLNYVGGIHRDYMRLQYLNPDQSVEIHQLYVYTGEGIAGQIQMRLYFCHAHWTQHWK